VQVYNQEVNGWDVSNANDIALFSNNQKFNGGDFLCLLAWCLL